MRTNSIIILVMWLITFGLLFSAFGMIFYENKRTGVALLISGTIVTLISTYMTLTEQRTGSLF